MMEGLWGKKIGMTQVFTDHGKVVPVTVIDLAHWVVTQIKTDARDGYQAVQLGCLRKKYEGTEFAAEWLSEPQSYFSTLKEVRVVPGQSDMRLGQLVDIEALL